METARQVAVESINNIRTVAGLGVEERFCIYHTFPNYGAYFGKRIYCIVLLTLNVIIDATIYYMQ